MEKEEEQTTIYTVWIDWEKRVISFDKADGFERLEYASHKEMLDFVVQKGFAGFAIQ